MIIKAVLDKDEYFVWSVLQWHQSCHSSEMTSLRILLAHEVPWFAAYFLVFLFATAEVASFTAIPQFQYMKFMNQFNDQLPVVLPSQLVRAVHRYLKGQGSIPGKPGRFWLRWSSLHLYVTTTTTNTLSQKPRELERVSSENKGKQPKAKRKVQ